MKKPMLIAAGFILSATLGMSLNAVAYDREYPILDRVLAEAEIENTFNNDHKELKNLADPEAAVPFEHLYLYMVQNVKVGPHEAAVKEVSKRRIPIFSFDFEVGGNGYGPSLSSTEVEVTTRAYTRSEVEQIVVNGDLSPITKNNRSAIRKEIEGDVEDGSAASVDFWAWKEGNYSFETIEDEVGEKTAAEVLNEYNTIMAMYNREVEFQRANRSLSYELLANEMFWNGDIGDSAGVDIMADLDLIHFILFGNYMEMPDRSDGDVSLASEMLNFQDDAAAEWVLLQEESEDPVVYLSAEEDSKATEDFDANVCYEDDGLREAVDAFEGYIETLTPEGVDPETGAVPILSIPDSVSTVSGDVDSGETQSLGEDEEDRDEAIDNLSDALKTAKGEWTRGLPCGERFCITVDLKSASWGTTSQEQGTVGAYDDGDNCVACHVAYINEAMKETMSKSMAPGKVSMNFFEDATCKESGTLINLDMNVYAIAKPIVLDPGNEIMKTAMDDFEDLETLLVNARGLFRTDGTNKTLKTADEVACSPYYNLQDMIDASGLSLEESLDKCTALSEELAGMTQEVLEEYQFETKALQNANMYEIMSSQLYSMLLVIQEMQAGLESTYKTNQKPLSELQNKEYCS